VNGYATKNQAVFQCTNIMLVHVHDVLRGLISAQAEVSPVAAAALLRISLGNRSRSWTPEKLSLFSGLDTIRIQGKPVSVLCGQILSSISGLPVLRAQVVEVRRAVPRERLPRIFSSGVI
jgi:hypothetical protein